MTELVLTAQPRTKIGRQTKILRRDGILPAVLYGKNTETTPVQINYREFAKIFELAGESTLITLQLDGKPFKVIIHDVTKNAVSDKFDHVDFHQVDLKEKVEAEIELQFEGTPPAVKDLGGVLVKSLDKIKVEALPQDLVAHIVVDISNLKNFDDIIHVSDLKIPDTLKILDRGDETVALVQAPRSEAELEELDKTVEDKVDQVEKLVKEKEPGEEAEEANAEETKKAE
ncbi:MAG: 50S ribosomal protein L25 [Patescibacteria group bacterium]|jgi:large subunit ribosomal protein L25